MTEVARISSEPMTPKRRTWFSVTAGLFAAPGTDVPHAGGEGVGWGLAAVAGRVAMAAAAWWESRVERPA
jgi:hypothetical protein